MHPPSVWAMRAHTLAKTFLGFVAFSAPALAVESKAKQSVRMEGGKGLSLSTVFNAQASADAAVLHQCGGCPFPKASKSPVAEVTTMANPVDRN